MLPAEETVIMFGAMLAPFRVTPGWIVAFAVAVLAAAPAGAAGEVEQLAAENSTLRQRVAALEVHLASLQRQVDSLVGKVADSRSSVGPPLPTPAPAARERALPDVRPSDLAKRVIISGEVGAVYIDGEDENAFSTAEFRVDDAKVYLDAEVTRGVYAFAEFDVTTRENDEEFRMGEVYLELDDIGTPLGLGRRLTLRLGRLDVPFGEEYLARGMVTNPLISHSLADFWGVDEGIEVFGRAAGWDFVAAIQNGSHDSLADFTSSKSATVRIGRDFERLHLGFSAMRTGDIDPVEERLSELWWGGAFVRSIGNPATTTAFGAELWQAEGAYRWTSGHVLAAGGELFYNDNDTSRSNSRTMQFGMVEGVQALGDFFGAARYSHIDTGGGYPIAGHAAWGKYFFGPFQTAEAWRLSLGLGYRFTEDLVFKFEYSLERGTLSNGADRTGMDQIATQAAVRF